MDSLVASSVNLLILIAILVFKLRAPLKEFVAKRHESIRDEIRSVHEQLKSAKAQFNETSIRLKSVDGELASLREQTKNDIAQIHQKIIGEAKRLSTVVVSDAKLAADALFSELKGQLYSELGTRVLDRAEDLLHNRLTHDDRVRIRQEFSNQVESIR